MNHELMEILDDNGCRTVQEQYDEIMQLFTAQKVYLCEQCTRELFNGETDDQIAKRKIAEWVTAFIKQSDGEIPTYKLTMWDFIDWLDEREEHV